MSRQVRRQRQEGIRPDTLKRIGIYTLMLLMVGAAQCSFFARLTFLPATPDLMLGVVVAVALIDSPMAGAAVAVGGGFVIDAIGGVGVSLSPLIYLAIAVVSGLLSGKFMVRWVSFDILLLPALFLRSVATMIGAMLFAGSLDPKVLLLELLLPELLVTALFCLPLYVVVRLCTLPLKDRRDRTVY